MTPPRLAVPLVATLLVVPQSAGWSSPRPVAGLTCDGAPATILGTEGDDVPRGTDDRDVVQALGGEDLLKGLEGDDLLCGGAGADVLEGGVGDDVLWGGANGTPGSGQDGLGDAITPGPGEDSVHGGLAAEDPGAEVAGDDVLDLSSALPPCMPRSSPTG